MRGKDRAGFGQESITLVEGRGTAKCRFAPRGLSAGGFNRQAEVIGSLPDFGKKSIGAKPITSGRQQLRSQAFGLYQQQHTPVLAGYRQRRFKTRPGL